MSDPIVDPVTDPKPAPAPAPSDPKTPDLVKVVEGLIAKHGDPNAALRVLLSENYNYRDQLRELKAKLPADGALILTGDDAKDWSTYRQFGKPSELRKAIEEGSTATAERDSLRKAGQIREAADLHGFKPTVLQSLAEKLDLKFGDVKSRDGKTTVRKALVVTQGDDGKPVETELDSFAETNWKDFLPALRPSGTEPARAPLLGTPPRTAPAPPRVPIEGTKQFVEATGLRVPRV